MQQENLPLRGLRHLPGALALGQAAASQKQERSLWVRRNYFCPHGRRIWTFSGEIVGKDGKPQRYTCTTLSTLPSAGTSCSATSYDDFGSEWSSDGLFIGFARRTHTAGFVPYIMNSDGTRQQPLLGNNSQVRGRFLAWSPDKEWVFIANNRGGPPYLVKVDGTQSFEIKQIPERAIVTDWVP